MLEIFNRPPDTPITIEVDSIENWREPFLQGLRDKIRQKLVRQAGSSVSKDLYTDPNKKHAYLVIIDLKSQIHKQQVQSQIEFYARYSQDPLFTAVVVPMTARLVMQHGKQEETVGMRQEYYGTDIRDLKRLGGKVSGKQIEEFVNHYRRLIEHTGYSHGDLVVSRGTDPIVHWEHVRMGNRGLRLIDYYGQDGKITMGLQRYSPGDPTYSTVRDQEPDALRTALSQFFRR